MKRKTEMLLLLLVVCMAVFAPNTIVWAASGSTTVAVSDKTADIGDTLKITVKAAGPSGEKTVATMTVSYDASVLQFVDCSTTYGGGGSSVTATSDSFTVTLKAIAAGTSKISVSGSDGVIFDTNEELDSVAGSSTTITVNNAAASAATEAEEQTTADSSVATEQAQLSADNSLKTLTISPGTLSPEFSGSVTKYTASVDNDVTRIAVTATPVNEKASVESVTGNDNLSVGENTVLIVVKAENGVTATYTITVTRRQAASEASESAETVAAAEEETEQQDATEEGESQTGETAETEAAEASEAVETMALAEEETELEELEADLQYLQEQYTALMNQYTSTKSSMLKVIIALIFVIIILIMALVNVITRVFSPKDTENRPKEMGSRPKEKSIKSRPKKAPHTTEKKAARKTHFSDALEEDTEDGTDALRKTAPSIEQPQEPEKKAAESVTEPDGHAGKEHQGEPEKQDDLEILDLNDL